jgi:hypothetical protein
MKYLLTIYGDESNWENASPEDVKPVLDAYDAFTREATERGAFLGGEGLQPTQTATTVRVRDDERILTDGPFAETKEQLGGYYLLDCKDLDEAIEFAGKIPGAVTGCVEVRPVMDYEAASGADQQAERQGASS